MTNRANVNKAQVRCISLMSAQKCSRNTLRLADMLVYNKLYAQQADAAMVNPYTKTRGIY